MKRIRYCVVALMAMAVPFVSEGRKMEGRIAFPKVESAMSGKQMRVYAEIRLDSVTLGANDQFFITPVIEDSKGNTEALPSVLINGRNMHYVWERGSLGRGIGKKYDVAQEVKRQNGKSQSVEYTGSIAMQRWMLDPSASVRMVVDTCGCGHAYGSSAGNPVLLELNPAPRMRVAYLTPEVTELPVSIHEGKARVQFEVDKTELHVGPYRCKNGQLIDNRKQLEIIEDSIRYALSDPNVEIARIRICGYASPESPYLHNEYLATNRSRALAEHIAASHNLESEKCVYDAVAENWEEFRQIVEESKDISERQRETLLKLIDRSAYGPADYDAKERELKTSPEFSTLYKKKILPEWFPRLRATKFEISTRLKPMDDKKLAEVMEITPEKLSLNQMFRVARLYPEGSDDFNSIIEKALKYYPESPDANLNVAVAAIKRGDISRAEELLKHAGTSPEAENARGIVAAYKGDFKVARGYFQNANNLPEAVKNNSMLGDDPINEPD